MREVTTQQYIPSIVSNRQCEPRPRTKPQHLTTVPIINTRSTITQVNLPSLYVHNIRSLNHDKFSELKLLAPQYDLIMIQETWLNSQKDSLYNIDNFTLHTCHRGNKRTGGGVAVYVKEHLAVTKLCDYTNRHTSAYWFLLHQPNHPPVIYGNIYHPPNLLKRQRDETINHIITTMSKYLNKHKSAKFCLCGDFNDLETGAITTLIPITQLVDFPTRGENILDKIFTDVDEYINIGCNRQPAILLNDHCALSIGPTSRKQQPRYHTIRERIPPNRK